MTSRPSYTRLLIPIAVFAIVTAMLVNWSELAGQVGLRESSRVALAGRDLVAVLAWLSAAWAINRLLGIVVWHGVLGQGGRRHVPRLLVDLAGVVVFAIAFFSLASMWFEFEIASSAVATSGILVAVLGFALRDTIADIFSGITVNLERPYRIGDWIELQPGGRVGEVVEISWRTTRLVTQDQVSVMVPNGLLSRIQFANYSLPERHFRDAVKLRLPPSLSAERAKQVLGNATKGIVGILVSPAPEVRVVDVERQAILYEVRYWVPDYRQLTGLRDQMISSLLEHLDKAGIGLALERQEVTFQRAAERPHRRLTPLELLRRIELFDVLDDRDVSELVKRAQEKRVISGEAIVQAGEAGSSLFVLAEGLLEVQGLGPEGQSVRLAKIEPGGVFGEMSLLTGQPRSATIVAVTDALVYEVDGEALRPMLQRRQELAQLLSDKIARRINRNEATVTERPPVTPMHDEISLSEQILSRLRAFFRLER